MKKVITLDKTKLILLGVIGILLLGLALSLYRKDPTPHNISLYQKQIDSLNIELKHLEQDQIILNHKLKMYKDSLVVYNHKIDSLNQNITKIRNYYGKKIRDINNASPTEIYDFITNRYK
jgi:exonuclease VII small subunit